MRTDHVIDTVGRYCPVPIVETMKKMKELSTGETLTVISDDEGILPDMRNWCEMTGNTYLGDARDGAEISVFIRKDSI